MEETRKKIYRKYTKRQDTDVKRIYYLKNRDKFLRLSRERYKKDPEKARQYWKEYKQNNTDRTKAFYLKNKEKFQDRHLKKRYGISLNQRMLIEHEQGFVCAICKGRYPLVVDHDHKTGKVRGLLCNSCNKGLGSFKDEKALLSAAITYLG